MVEKELERAENAFDVMPNIELIEKAANGDESAFAELFMSSYRYVFAVAKTYLSNEDDMRDAIQETFIRVYKNLGRLQSPESYFSWIGKIAENCSKDIIAKNGNKASYLEEEESFLFLNNEEIEKRDISIDLKKVLEQLPEEQCQLLTYVYYDGFKIKEIAKMQGKPATTVYSQFNAAKKKLKDLLKLGGIDKPFYGGEFISMVTTAFRDAIGTSLLSASVAQEILDNTLGKKDSGSVIIASVIKKQRNKAVLRVASIITAFCLLICILTIILLKPFISKSSNVTYEYNYIDSPSKSEDTVQSEVASSQINSITSSALQNSGILNHASLVTSSKKETSSVKVGNIVSANKKPQQKPKEIYKGPINKIGNTFNNVVHGKGLIAKQGDWVYTVKGGKGKSTGGNILYRISTDGKVVKRLVEATDDIENLNVIGQKIYYTCQGTLYSVDFDGSNKTRIAAMPYRNYAGMQIIGDMCYFTSEHNNLDTFHSGKHSYLNMKTLETGFLPTREIYSFSGIIDGELYYNSYSHTLNNRLYYKAYALNLSTMEERLIFDSHVVPWSLDKKLLFGNEWVENGVITAAPYNEISQDIVERYYLSPYEGGTLYGIRKGTNNHIIINGEGKEYKITTSTYAISYNGYYTFDDDYVYYESRVGLMGRFKANGTDGLVYYED